MRDAEGRTNRWLGTCTDISDIVAAREAIGQEADRLEQMVAERTRDLQEAQTRLAHAQRMEALGQLAGGIAHDFNNVLQTVQGGAALIEQRAGDAERTRRLARTVLEAAARGMAITRRLLAFSRYSDLRSEPVDAAALLAGMVEIFAYTLGRGIEVRMEVAPGLPRLLADKGQLETVLINLATNARDAMQGMGTLILAAAAETLAQESGPRHPITLKAGDYVRLAVTDTGIGMDAETLPRALEPFFTTKPVGRGTGLGLSIAQGFADQSGGGLHIESIPGRGTTVTLWLPIATELEPQAAASNDPGADADVTSEHACVLVVDDDDAVREIVAEQLEMLGYGVLPARSGSEALALLEEGERVGLILSDLSMPGMDGITLIREAQRRQPGLPAILLTGFATQGAELALKGATGDSFSVLLKPVRAQLLADRVAVLLENARKHSRHGRSELTSRACPNETKNRKTAS
jgi:signal transduction histidine kinase/CheY-like chemotaxis protein